VGLDVAVEEGEAGLVGGELDGGAAVEGHDDGVLDEAAGGLAVEVDEFELVAMQVYASCSLFTPSHQPSTLRIEWHLG
jgi:hypothetical protein